MHIDESGNQDLSEGRYCVAVVLHDHSEDVEGVIRGYEMRLTEAGLPDIPFHGKDLLHGKEAIQHCRPGTESVC